MAAKKKRRKRSNPKRKAHRKNPAPKRRRKRSNPAVAAAPKRRHRRRKNPARARRRNPARRRRRNPSVGFMQIGTWAVGGLGAYGAVWGAKKLAESVTNPYAQLGIQAAAPLVVALPAAFLGAENIAAGALGGFAFQLPTLIMQGYNIYKAQSATPQAATKAGQQGLRGLPIGMPIGGGIPATISARR